MLTHLKDIGTRTAMFEVSPISDIDIKNVLSVIEKFYGESFTSATICPIANESQLRSELVLAVPDLVALAAQLKTLLETEYSSIFVPRLGLADLEINHRIAVLYAISLFMGRPTSTGKVDRRVAWDVKVRESGASTFSEHADEADLHTDTQYYPEPERYTMLYCVTPAKCGGGISSVRDVSSIKSQLQQTSDGMSALRLLSEIELPFKVPAVFTQTGSFDADEVTFAKVFGTRPTIRYRSDTLKKGLALYPELDTMQLREALNTLSGVLQAQQHISQYYQEADGCSFMNNHEALHGRQKFTDIDRYVVRIRIADDVSIDAAQFIPHDKVV